MLLRTVQGKDGSPSTAASLKKAADILQESFDPIIDLSSGRDLLPVMVYAQELGAWDYTGMYSALLKHQVPPLLPGRPISKSLIVIYQDLTGSAPVCTEPSSRTKSAPPSRSVEP